MTGHIIKLTKSGYCAKHRKDKVFIGQNMCGSPMYGCPECGV